MISSVFGFHNDNTVQFLTEEAASEYLIRNNPEHCTSKDSTIEFIENNLWEDPILTCKECGKRALGTEDVWRPCFCCDQYYCDDCCRRG